MHNSRRLYNASLKLYMLAYMLGVRSLLILIIIVASLSVKANSKTFCKVLFLRVTRCALTLDFLLESNTFAEIYKYFDQDRQL